MQHKLNPEQGKPHSDLWFLFSSLQEFLCSVNPSICPHFASIAIRSQVRGLSNLRGKLQEQHGERRQGAGPRI